MTLRERILENATGVFSVKEMALKLADQYGYPSVNMAVHQLLKEGQLFKIKRGAYTTNPPPPPPPPPPPETVLEMTTVASRIRAMLPRDRAFRASEIQVDGCGQRDLLQYFAKWCRKGELCRESTGVYRVIELRKGERSPFVRAFHANLPAEGDFTAANLARAIAGEIGGTESAHAKTVRTRLHAMNRRGLVEVVRFNGQTPVYRVSREDESPAGGVDVEAINQYLCWRILRGQ